jgi:hypothetical protein
MRTNLIVIMLVGAAAFTVLAINKPRRARATDWPWVEAWETSHRHYHIEGGGFTPGHQVVIGAFRPAPGPPPVPSGPGSHWFAGHAGPYADANGEFVWNDYYVSAPCGQMLPFIACDNNEIGGGGCLNWLGPIGSTSKVTDSPSYNWLSCP